MLPAAAQVSADASARCTAVKKRGTDGGLLPGGFWLAFLTLLLAIALYYAAFTLGYLGPEWDPHTIVRGLREPYDFPGATEEG